MSENNKSDGLTVAILIALGVVVLAALAVGSMGLRKYQLNREQERRAQAARNLAQIRLALESIVIIGQVEGWEPVASETIVHASPATVKAPFWIVKLKVLETPGHNYPIETCNILVNDALSELGVHSVGQKIRIVTRRTNSPPKLLEATAEERSIIVWAEPGGPLELIAHEPME